MRLAPVLLLALALPAAAQELASAQDLLDRLDALAVMTNDAAREAETDALWSALQATGPIPFVRADTAVFLYRGSDSTVAVAGDFNSWTPSAGAMTRLGTSDLWARLDVFPETARLDYKLVVGDQWMLDPANPHQQWGGAGPNSELRMPGWSVPPETVPDPDLPTGAFTDDLTLESTTLGYPVPYRVYTPAGYDTLAALPVLYITDGHEYSDDRLGAARTVLDHLIHDGRAAPVIAVFVDPREVGHPSNNQRQAQYVHNPAFADFIADELVSAIDAAYRTRPDARHRVILGTSLGGLFAAYLGALHPETFQRLAIQSPAFWVSENAEWWSGPSIYDLVADAPDGLFTVYLSTGTIGDTRTEARRMRDILEEHGHTVTYREVPEGHSWGNWRALLDEMLVALLPGPAAPSAP